MRTLTALLAAILLPGCAAELEAADQYATNITRSGKKVVKVGSAEDCPPFQSRNKDGNCEADNYDQYNPSAQPSGIHGDPMMIVGSLTMNMRIDNGGALFGDSTEALDVARYGNVSGIAMELNGLENAMGSRGEAPTIARVQVLSDADCSRRECLGDALIFTLSDGTHWMTEDPIDHGDVFEFETPARF